MRYVRLAIVLAAAGISGACFHFSTLISVRPDGSGTLHERLVFTPTAIAQLRGLASLAGGGNTTPKDFDPISEQQARDAAASFGTGVTYVSSTPINETEGQGRDITYAFRDINQLRLTQGPPSPAGASVSAPGLGTDAQMAFVLSRNPDGSSVLKIIAPQLSAIPGAGSGAGGLSSGMTSPDQIALLRPMFAGAKFVMAVEPVGQLIRTSNPYVDGSRVTLADVSVDALLADDTLLRRVQEAKSPDEAKEILKAVPGLKVNLDRETTIEFK